MVIPFFTSHSTINNACHFLSAHTMHPPPRLAYTGTPDVIRDRWRKQVTPHTVHHAPLEQKMVTAGRTGPFCACGWCVWCVCVVCKPADKTAVHKQAHLGTRCRSAATQMMHDHRPRTGRLVLLPPSTSVALSCVLCLQRNVSISIAFPK